MSATATRTLATLVGLGLVIACPAPPIGADTDVPTDRRAGLADVGLASVVGS